MQHLKSYAKTHRETIITLLGLFIMNVFAALTYHEKENLFSLIYMLFACIYTLKIIFNKINA